jgi:hypothetical protein
MFDLLQEWSQNIAGIGATGLTIPGSKPGRSQRFLAMEPAQLPVRWVPGIFLGRVIRLEREVDQSHLLLGLRMSRATSVVPLCAFGSWTRLTLPFCRRNKNGSSSCRGVARGYYGSPSYDVTSYITHTKSRCLYVAQDVLHALVTHKILKPGRIKQRIFL